MRAIPRDVPKRLQISEKEFLEFLTHHEDLHPISETNDDLKGSYLMIDPLGRFFQNTNNALSFSDPILDVGVFNAVRQVGWNYTKFRRRGGNIYLVTDSLEAHPFLSQKLGDSVKNFNTCFESHYQKFFKN